MSDTILQFEKVRFGYQPNQHLVLPEFSLQVPEGSITAILGPNGAGKTTMLHLALGWLAPMEGQIWLAGRPLKQYPRRELGKWIGLVPQSEHIHFDFSLLEYALLGRAPYLNPLEMPSGKDYQLAEKILEQIGLGDMSRRSILNISGGEKQMAMIARVMVQQPRLLLLDEPTSHLDMSNKARLIKQMRKLAEQGMTIVFTTHEPEFAVAIATELVLMQRGKILRSGKIREVLSSENLSTLYNMPVEVINMNGRQIVVWA